MIAGLGEKLKTLREQRGYSQSIVGKAVGVAPSSIGHYETSTATPSAEVMLKLAAFYGVTTDYLYGLDKSVPESRDMVDLNGLTVEAKKQIRQQVELLRKLSANEKQ